MRGSATVIMNAPADRVWALISDVTQIGRFSPETFEAEWLDGATGPAEGARFRGHVRRNEKGPVYWTDCTVVTCEPGRRFGFEVRARPSGPPDTAIITWTYTLAPSTEGTEVTESFELAPKLALRIYWALLGWARGRRNHRDMLRTLNAIKAVVESPEPV